MHVHVVHLSHAGYSLRQTFYLNLQLCGATQIGTNNKHVPSTWASHVCMSAQDIHSHMEHRHSWDLLSGSQH